MLPLGQPFAPIEAFARLLTWPGRTWWELLHEPTPFRNEKKERRSPATKEANGAADLTHPYFC